MHKGGHAECDLWKPFQLRVADAFEADVSAFNRVNDIFSTASGQTGLSACTQCTRRADAWSAQVIRKISTLPQFSLSLPDRTADT